MSSQHRPTPVSVVVQTHWDREWYFTHQQFIARLLHVMERVVVQLESGQLESFLFDGQTAAMEDLLANCEPELAARVKRLVRAQRIVLGPWYISADQFLCNGESLLRNLEIGMADAAALGNCQRVGYLPDTFGHVGQMPQMLRIAGIDKAVMWRGVDAAHAEFDWKSPDGSTVGAYFLTQGYYQHPFNVPDWERALGSYLEQAAPRSLSHRLLLTQGGDHLSPGTRMAERIAHFNSTQDQVVLAQDTLENYLTDAMAGSEGKRPVIEGELRENRQAFVLPDVLSTRRYLKRLNQQAEDRLLGVVEPLYAQLDVPFPAAYMEQTWRLLLQQQAHDSICGCSIDAVHDEMRTRYMLLDQRLDALTERACAAAGMIALEAHEGHAASVFADDTQFTLFNPLPQRFAGWHAFTLFMAGDAAHALHIDAGRAIENCVLDSAPHSILRSPLDDFPDPVSGHLYTVAIRCDLGGMEALACTVRRAEAPAQKTTAVASRIENQAIAIDIDNGRLRWTDKAAGTTMHDPLSLLSELDAGDTYNFSPPPTRHTTLQQSFTLVEVRHYAAMQEMLLAVAMDLPAGLNQDRSGAGEARVACRGTLRLRLWQDGRAAECQLDWDNAAMDQRTRLLMPLPSGLAHTGSDSAFSWEERAVALPSEGIIPLRSEAAVTVNPTQSTILVGTLAFCHVGMQEYAITQHEGRHYLAVTLVRSVGWLSRRDLATRGAGAGPDLATPGAQCLGSERFGFSIGHAAGAPQALEQARRLRRPPVLLRGHSTRWRPGFEIAADLQVAALRRQGDGIELRTWDPASARIATLRRPA